jgi:hypothetical protein
MKSGEIRPYRGGSILVAVGIWAEKDKAGYTNIHLASRPHFHSTVTDNPSRKRYHPTLVKVLKSLLAKHAR